MNANYTADTAARRGRIRTATNVILTASAIALGAMSLTPAMANAEAPGPFGRAYLSCAMDAYDLFHDNKISYEQYQAEEEDCCLNLRGTYNEQNGECYFDGEPTVDDTKPRPGATVKIPPGLNTRARIQ
jgi:hypothetical protein